MMWNKICSITIEETRLIDQIIELIINLEVPTHEPKVEKPNFTNQIFEVLCFANLLSFLHMPTRRT